jgi:hypothetical protein
MKDHTGDFNRDACRHCGREFFAYQSHGSGMCPPCERDHYGHDNDVDRDGLDLMIAVNREIMRDFTRRTGIAYGDKL